MIFCEIIKLLTSREINNFGILLSGIGSFMLGVGALKSLDLFKDWQKQKQFEKRSNIAEEALNRFELFNNNLYEWMNFVNICVFSRESQINSNKFKSLDKDGQKILSEEWDKDPYELRNYLRRGNSIWNGLSLVSFKAACLQDSHIIEELKNLRLLIKKLLNNLSIKHFPDIDKASKDEAIECVEELSKQINCLCESIHKNLTNVLMFKK